MTEPKVKNLLVDFWAEPLVSNDRWFRGTLAPFPDSETAVSESEMAVSESETAVSESETAVLESKKDFLIDVWG